jgi:hypothetical protein
MAVALSGHRRVLVRDLAIFQLKLVLDGLKGVFVLQLSIGAAVFDFVFGRPGRTLLFYRVLRLSERFDLWLNLYNASGEAEMNRDGLFGASRAGSDTLVGKLEEIVRQRVEPQQPAA